MQMQSSGSHDAENRFGGTAAASLVTPLSRGTFLCSSLQHSPAFDIISASKGNNFYKNGAKFKATKY